MNLLDRFLSRQTFDSYADFVHSFDLRVPDRFNVAVDVVDAYAEACPEKRALVWCNDHGDERQFSFGDLRDLSNRTASFLRSLGIGHGDRVMLILKGRYEFWLCLLALHKLGAVAIPATHMLRAKDLVYRITEARISALICIDDPELIAEVEAAQKRTGDRPRSRIIVAGSRAGWHDFERGLGKVTTPFDPAAYPDAPSNSDAMLIYFTSGTAGLPKMVCHDFLYPLAHILTARYWQCVEDDGLHYTVADSGWAKAVWGKIYGQWLAGSAVFVYDYDRFKAANVLRQVARVRVTTFCAPPTVYRMFIKENLDHYDLSSLRACVTAGEPLNPDVYQQFYRQTGLRLKEGYGQTELVITAATWPWIEPKPGSMGRPAPTYDIHLLDPEGNRVSPGEEGEIVIRTHPNRPLGIFSGYLNDLELTKRVWHDGWYHTGDLAYQDEDGYLWFIGRADDVIKSSGYRIGPFEVENTLMQHPAVLECAVTGTPDAVRGQVVKATVVLSPGYGPSAALRAELQQHVRSSTAAYKYPRLVEFVEQLPKTISGKIRRTEIREREARKTRA